METYEELIASDTLILVDFYASWCSPCQTMHPILEELKKIKGDSLRIAKIDVDKHPDLVARQRIHSVPTLILYRKGELLWRQSGAISLNQLKNIIEKYE